MQTQHTHKPGWGADRDFENRPGVPREIQPPEPIGAAHWSRPEPMKTVTRSSLITPTRTLTPVYATPIPPRGISGMIRVAAYRVPEYRPRRWMMLMLADRIDVLEHNLPRTGLLLGGLGALALIFMAGRSKRRSASEYRSRRLRTRSVDARAERLRMQRLSPA